MKTKIKYLIILVLSMPFVAGIFGIVHNQITYSVSSEFFTEFVFHFNSIGFYLKHNPRFAASIVGFFSSWWVGLPMGLIIGFTGLKSLDKSTFLKLKIQTVLCMMISALIFLCIGYIIGSIFNFDIYSRLIERHVNDELGISLSSVQNIKQFEAVAFMHTFSYYGGALSVFISFVYQMRLLKKYQKLSEKHGKGELESHILDV